jgi:hypothetical protein
MSFLVNSLYRFRYYFVNKLTIKLLRYRFVDLLFRMYFFTHIVFFTSFFYIFTITYYEWSMTFDNHK